MSSETNYDHKRKLDDTEDIWEREASSSTRPEPPNEFARMISVLDDQNDELKNTCALLEENLVTLKASLTEIEKQLSDENHRVEEQNLLYDRALYKTVELVQSVFHRRQQDEAPPPSRRIQHETLAAYLKSDKQLYEHVDHTLKDIRGQLPFLAEPDQEENQKRVDDIERQVASYRQAALARAKAQAKCKAFKAKTAALEKELRKLNGLPQILQIVRTSTEKHRDETRVNRQAQRQLIQDHAEPLLSKIADATIRQPLVDALHRTDKTQLQMYSNRLDEIYKLLIKQRASEQLVSYACEADAERWKQSCNVLMAFVEELGERNASHQTMMDVQQEMRASSEQPFTEPSQDDELISHIDTLLSRGYLKKDLHTRRRRSFNEESILTKVNSLLQHEKRWKEKWTDNFGASLDAAKVIEDTKHDLLDTLYEDSISRDHLILLPSSYTDAQGDLEIRTNELQDTLADLENESAMDPKLEEMKHLLTLFLTDPDAFGEEMAAKIRHEEE